MLLATIAAAVELQEFFCLLSLAPPTLEFQYAVIQTSEGSVVNR